MVLGTTIFAEMSALAASTGAVNLGQGFPDTDGPVEVTEAARAAISSAQNQYAPGIGVESLRKAISAHQQRFYGLGFDPDREVLVTTGATEAIAATILALCEPGDSVVSFEPYYDSYGAAIALAGAEHRVVPLRPPRWSFDLEQLAEAVTDRTRSRVGEFAPQPDRQGVRARRTGGDRRTLRRARTSSPSPTRFTSTSSSRASMSRSASFPGMRDRTVTISSVGKTFSVTGWKIGWICARQELVTAVRTVKQFLTYVSGTPFQHAVARRGSLCPTSITPPWPRT